MQRRALALLAALAVLAGCGSGEGARRRRDHDPGRRPRPQRRGGARRGHRHPHAQRRSARLRAARPRRQAARRREGRAALGRRGRRVARGGPAAAPARTRRWSRSASTPRAEPHWWQDPRAAIAAVAADPRRADEGRPRRRGALRGQRRPLHSPACARSTAPSPRCIATIPPARRKLVTTHDALGAYARRYGLEVIATVIPSRSTRGQASAGETAELVRTIRREKVPAVFAESSVRVGRRARDRARGGRARLAAAVGRLARPEGLRRAPPTWARWRPTRTRSPARSAATSAAAHDHARRVLRPLHAARARRDRAARRARGRARRLDRAAAARVLHPFRRHRHLPGPRGRRPVGDRAAARGAARRARLRGGARAARPRPGGGGGRRDRDPARRRARARRAAGLRRLPLGRRRRPAAVRHADRPQQHATSR